MRTNELRQKFLDYFANKGHTVVPSSSLIPTNDPTLLFTNAGMNQFKDVFLGREKRDYTRAASSQCCVRAGGKHNDLENVGFTARHHTFFEMLGNFSFGDYFKSEAINYAWGFLTNILKLDPKKLWVTVYKDDQEAEDIWLKELKIDPKRFKRCGAEDNFWSMGDTGPCGPCSEIFYEDVEIWNLVFMQYNRDADGNLTPLPKPSVDTGMGLERIAAVMQGVKSNYDIDIFKHLIKEIRKFAKVKDQIAMNVIADHIRACVFLIADGVKPGNEGRGYVLRRIIRRALRFGNKLDIHEPFFYLLVAPLVQEMGQAYPKLQQQQQYIEHVLQGEEKQFAITLEQGLKILRNEMVHQRDKIIAGATAFKLYDTYGFPLDLTRDIAAENGLNIDEAGFAKQMQLQQEKSKQTSKFNVDYTKTMGLKATKFVGYDTTSCDTKITHILQDNILILDTTPFYAESGGQVGDTGIIYTDNAKFCVTDTQKNGDIYLHHGFVDAGGFKTGDKVQTQIDIKQRQKVAANHSASHLLHATLRQVLGNHVEQKGSFVNATQLRLDFSHLESVTAQEIHQVELVVNKQIRANLAANIELMSLTQAKNKGAMALFDAKYTDKVRVISFGGFSTELCGGTHVKATGDIGVFKITAESGVAAGIRRIEAITGEDAFIYLSQQTDVVKITSAMLKTEPDRMLNKLAQQLEQSKNNQRELTQLKNTLASHKGNNLTAKAVEIDGIKVLAAKLDDTDMQTLRNTIDQLKQNLTNAVILLATIADGKIQLVAGVSHELTNKYHAGKLMQYITSQLDGQGGGRADMAQGAGTNLKALDAALDSVVNWVKA